MIFIAGYWWLWLIIMVFSLGFAIYCQISRAQKLARETVKGITTVAKAVQSSELTVDTALDTIQAFGQNVESFLFGMKMIVVSFVVAALSGILFLTAIVINIVNLFR